MADPVRRLNEGPPHIMAADNAEFERQARLLGISDGSRHPTVGHRHNQFGITPAPNSWPLHLDDYHSPVKPQEYLKKRVELMRTFYEDRIPHYGQLEDVFKISVLVRNHVERTLQQAPQLTGEIRARDSYKASLIGTALARAALYSTVHAH